MVANRNIPFVVMTHFDLYDYDAAAQQHKDKLDFPVH